MAASSCIKCRTQRSCSFFYEVEPGNEGETPIVLSHIVYERMKERYPEFVDKLEEHGLIYNRVLGEDDDPPSPIGCGWKEHGLLGFALLVLRMYGIDEDDDDEVFLHEVDMDDESGGPNAEQSVPKLQMWETLWIMKTCLQLMKRMSNTLRKHHNQMRRALFANSVSFRNALKAISIKEGWEICWMKFEKYMIMAICASENCSFDIYVSNMQHEDTLQINPGTCWSVANLAAWCSRPRGSASTHDVLLLDAVRLCAGVPARSTVHQGDDEVRVEDGLNVAPVLRSTPNQTIVTE
ncbi:unnamed protein product [Prunus armeniaca]|uniref:Transposase MuDR plant domain-containing protein n=1 Tax=Prunus armeniaca TaxID=36596 RepID=A0A6J5W1L1_PRUAR|nr:unnamed protein product [Prunus armeniaca]